MRMVELGGPEGESRIIENVCALMSRGERDTCKAVLRTEYPVSTSAWKRPSMSKRTKIRIFLRDGFVDQYTGKRLIFPGTLLLLSIELPEQLPYHKNWKSGKCHQAFWELCATVDHLVPITMGGRTDDENLLTTSMLRNTAKANFKADELGWSRISEDETSANRWDGLSGWFLSYLDVNPQQLQHLRVRRWHTALKTEAARTAIAKQSKV